IYHAKEGCVLFHCRVGKDRTGVLAMLLLGLAGVEKKDIVANYEVSYTKLESLHDVESTLPNNYLYSIPEYIMQGINYIMDNYNSYENYLLSTGLTEEILTQIRKRLVYGI